MLYSSYLEVEDAGCLALQLHPRFAKFSRSTIFHPVLENFAISDVQNLKAGSYLSTARSVRCAAVLLRGINILHKPGSPATALSSQRRDSLCIESHPFCLAVQHGKPIEALLMLGQKFVREACIAIHYALEERMRASLL